MPKIYTVVNPAGEQLTQFKALSPAKKLADTVEGKVLCDGEVVYPAEPTPTPEPGPAADPLAERYTLCSRMNVRKAPSLGAQIACVLEQGTVIYVKEIKNDWLHLVDGTYILYGNGQYAEKGV